MGSRSDQVMKRGERQMGWDVESSETGWMDRGSSRVESALVRLFRVSSSEVEGGLDVAGTLSEWNDRLEGQRSRIARRLSLIDAQLGLTESHPVLSVVAAR
jgi:hypothetical protein